MGRAYPPQGSPSVSLSSQTWPLWVDLSAPQEKPRGQPHPQAHWLHTLVGSDYCGLPRGPRGRLSSRPGGAQLFLPFLFLPRNSLPPFHKGTPHSCALGGQSGWEARQARDEFLSKSYWART